MKLFKTKERLPKEGEYVLVWAGNRPWGGEDMSRFWKVAKFEKGLTEEDRERMEKEYEKTPTRDKCTTCIGSDGLKYIPKYKLYGQADVHGNNTVPYYWDEFGNEGHFGQDIEYWAYLPTNQVLEMIL